MEIKANGMLKKMVLAGLMVATALGGVAPAYAQRGENGGWRGQGGERAGRPDGGQGGARAQRQWQGGGDMRQPRRQGWEQRRIERPAQGTQPQGQWRGNPGRIEQRAPSDARWNREQQRFATPRGDDRSAQDRIRNERSDNRAGWQGNRRWDGNDRRDDRNDRRWDGNGRRDDRNDRRWHDNDQRWSGGNWNGGRRFDDRSRWAGQRRWDSGWRNDRRYDWHGYRMRYGDRYRLGRYYAPRGWNYGYSRFSIGIFLNSMLYANSYWIDDPYSYRLPPAYGSLRWVRYYDDALLVDIRDGYVVDVIHDFFW